MAAKNVGGASPLTKCSLSRKLAEQRHKETSLRKKTSAGGAEPSTVTSGVPINHLLLSLQSATLI